MQERPHRALYAFAGLFALLGTERAGLASDHMNLEEGLPTRIEDAYAIPYHSREIQLSGGYVRHLEQEDGTSADRFILQPRLELGVLRNMQLSVGAPLFFGEANTRHSGDLDVGAIYNINTETLDLPAFAVALHGVAPTGEHSRGVDTTFKFIAQRTIGDENLDRVYFNGSYSWKINSADGERDTRHSIAFGYSRRLTADMILVADIVRELQLEEDQEWNLLEMGVRLQLDPLTTLSVGGGPGFGDESPDLVATLGIQRSF